MALWALIPGIGAAALAFALGSIVGVGVGTSAALGVMVAVGGFAAQALALGWARSISPAAIQDVENVISHRGFDADRRHVPPSQLHDAFRGYLRWMWSAHEFDSNVIRAILFNCLKGRQPMNCIEHQTDGPIAVISLSRPKANALNLAMVRAGLAWTRVQPRQIGIRRIFQ